MEVILKKAKEYVSALMKEGNYTYEDAEMVSGIPASTIKKIVSGDTDDPRFSTLTKLIISLGGDVNELIDYNKKKEIEISTTISLKDSYDMRIDTLKEYIASLKRDKIILAVVVGVLMVVVVGLLVFDISLDTHDWFGN